MLYFDTCLEFSGATLLATQEVNFLLSRSTSKYMYNWWLRTPGSNKLYACYVDVQGYCYSYGDSVNIHFVTRPALIINNLGGFRVGDTFQIGIWKFKIISKNLAWLYKQDIGLSQFGEDNDYNSSKVKKFVDEWYEGLAEEMS